MIISPIEIWLCIGILFIIIEFSTIPGIGFLFLGLGALTTSSLIYFYPSLLNYQIATLGFTSVGWFLLLWWPLKYFIYSKNKQNYSDLIGQGVMVVDNPISSGQIGRVSWSGTIMNAQIDNMDQENNVEVGDMLFIAEVKGNILICTRKKSSKFSK